MRYCEKHLAQFRDRAREKSKKLGKAPHGRAPGTLTALAEARAKQAGKNLEDRSLSQRLRSDGEGPSDEGEGVPPGDRVP